jgi:hypothetical protein
LSHQIVFRHFREYGFVNEPGYDLISRFVSDDGEVFYFIWDAKDKGISKGILLDEGLAGSSGRLGYGDLENYINYDKTTKLEHFEFTYFNDELERLVREGKLEIPDSDMDSFQIGEEIQAAYNDGRLAVNIFGGGREDPFVKKLANLPRLLHPEHLDDLPFKAIIDGID